MDKLCIYAGLALSTIEITGLQAFEQVYKKFRTRYRWSFTLCNITCTVAKWKFFSYNASVSDGLLFDYFQILFSMFYLLTRWNVSVNFKSWVREFIVLQYIFLCYDNFISSAKYISIDGKIILITLLSGFSLRKPIFQNCCSLANF